MLPMTYDTPHSTPNHDVSDHLPTSLEAALEPSEPWRTLHAAFAPSSSVTDFSGSLPQAEELGLVTVCRPLIVRSAQRLRKRLVNLPSADAFDVETVPTLLVGDLVQRLKDIVIRPMAVELHAARLSGTLSGTTPEARFQSYIEALREPAACLKIFEEYPLMARRAVECCRQWEEVSFEWLERLERDFPELSTRLGQGRPLGRLVAMPHAGGDRHRGGRRVQIIELSCGARLVYKPRCLALDLGFQDLLRRLDASVPDFAFRNLRILDRREYGWVEYVEYKECADDGELECFYFRLGGQLALLYILQANDFHHENVIAHGPQPMLVDLETLLHPVAFDPTLHSKKYCVLEVGILPVESTDGTSLDLSALGADRQQVGRAMGWNHVGTDELRLEERSYGLKRVTSRPRQASAEGLVPHLAEAVLKGFRLAYRAIEEHKEAWITHLDGFADHPVRCVLRPTRVYQTLLRNQHHPARSRHATAAGLLLDELALDIPYRPYLERVVESERDDLVAGDVPIFHLRPGTTDLVDSRGQTTVDFFPRRPLDDVQQRIRNLDSADLANQERWIRQSLSLLDVERPTKVTRIPFDLPRAPHEPMSLLGLAQRIGDTLEAQAVNAGTGVTWVGYHRAGSGFLLNYLPPNLYSGQLGVVWFLAQLAQQTGQERFLDLARQGLTFFRHQQLGRLLLQPDIGVFDGLGGAAYVLGHLQAAWPEAGLSDDLERLLLKLRERIPADRKLDVVSGSAGCLLALLGLHRAGSSEALETAILCGETLLNAVGERDGHLTWQSDLFDHPQTGFSHGLTGLAMALAQLSVYHRRDELTARVARWVAYEDTFYDASQHNWQDIRHPDENAAESDGFMWAWCHGAPGIVAGRYAMARDLPKALASAVLERADPALPALERCGGSSENNLCHGIFGNLDLLLSVARERGDASLERRCRRFGEGAVERLLESGFLDGHPDDKRLGLMLGSSGIGYGLLRLHDPDVPSVLLLDGTTRTGPETATASSQSAP